MKPKEINRLFIDELEKLDHVPGLECNDKGAWNKIVPPLNDRWNKFRTGTLSTFVILVGFYFIQIFPIKASPTIQQNTFKEVKHELIDTTKKIINNNPLSKKENNFTTTNLSNIKNRNIIYIHKGDSLEEKAFDTLAALLPNFSTFPLRSGPLKNRINLNDSISKTDLNLYLPQLSFLKLRVRNELNFSSLVKSIRAEKQDGNNFYYTYVYDRSYVPSRYGSIYPQFFMNNTYIMSNFNK